MAQVISWDWAERTAIAVARQEPLARSYHADALEADFAEATALAEQLVAAETGLRSLAGPARAVVTDRAGWIRANVASFRRLLGPLSDTLGTRLTNPLLAPGARAVAGVEMGGLLGWMSTKVLGQYDLLIAEDDDPENQDMVYYVGPNVLAIERRYGFPPKEFRLWLALHELTHRAQFTGIDWMAEHFVTMVGQVISGIDPDPKAFVGRLRHAVAEVRAGRNPLEEGGLAAIVASEEQNEVLARIQGMMSLLEGHGDVTMDRAGRDLVPNAARFSAVLRERRRSASGPVRVIQQLLGLEAKMRQYAQGETFIEEVEAAGGPALVARAWEGPDMLPDLSEIRDPVRWIARVSASEPVGTEGRGRE